MPNFAIYPGETYEQCFNRLLKTSDVQEPVVQYLIEIIDHFNLIEVGPPGPTGPQGPIGIQGAQGVPGPQGPPGSDSTVPGPPGPQGIPGTAGINGSAGVNGKSATVTAGTTVTGAPGTMSLVVNSGSTSDAVFNFTIPQGIQGAQGIQGPAGVQGVQGPQGIQGPPGNDGTSVLLKGAVPSHANLPSTGNHYGDLWITSDTGHGWVWTAPGQWVDVGPIQGPPGPTGAPGTPGAQGPAGATGAQGATGATGAPGADSTVPGPPGPQGIKGDTGAPGPQGPTGSQGVKGDTGATGPQGPQGSTGADSTVPGPIGPQGPIGLTGLDGSPVGTVLSYTSATLPTGWLLCDGASYLRTTYQNLFNIIGTTFGSVDSTHFNVPDLRSKFILGAGQGTGLTNRSLAAIGGEETHVLLVAELASHAHGLGGHTHGMDHLHDLQNHSHLGVDHLHGVPGVDHLHSLQNHQHTYNHPNTSGPTWSGSGWTNAADWTGGPNVPTTAAADRSLATTTGAMDRGAQTGGPNVNNTGYASSWYSGWANTAGPSGISDGTGSDTAHNTMPPFCVLVYMVKYAVGDYVNGVPGPPGPVGPQGPAGPPGPTSVTAQVWGETPAGTINGSNRNFTSGHPYVSGLLAVFLNGMRLRPSNDYVETGTQSFQFIIAPLAGDSLSIDYIQP